MGLAEVVKVVKLVEVLLTSTVLHNPYTVLHNLSRKITG
jgi:hypothetical protein